MKICLVYIYRREDQQRIFARAWRNTNIILWLQRPESYGSANQRKKSGSLYVSKVGGVDVACQAPRGVVMASFSITLHLYIFYGILKGI